MVQGEAPTSTPEAAQSFRHPPTCVTNFGSNDWTVCRMQGFTINPLFLNFKRLRVNQPLALNSIQSGRNRKKMSQAFSNNQNSFNVANTFYTLPYDASKILAWLSPLEPWVRHRDIGAQRVDSIGTWLLETSEFRSWHNGSKGGSNKATVFCHGNPGVGKSHIM